MAAPLIVPLILLGGATIALAAASAKKKKPAQEPDISPGVPRTYTLDANMPPQLRDQVLAALSSEKDPAKLEAFASAIASSYPLAAAALRTKEAMLSIVPPLPSPQPAPAPAPAPPVPIPTPPVPAPTPVQPAPIPIPVPPIPIPIPIPPIVPPSPSPAPPAPSPMPPAPSPVPTPPAPSPVPVVPGLLGGLDPGMPLEMQKAVVGALTTESDPAKLEGFASAIQGQYPVAAGLLMAKAQALRLVHPSAPPAPTPTPPSPKPPTPPAPTPINPPVPPSPGPSVPSIFPIGDNTTRTGRNAGRPTGYPFIHLRGEATYPAKISQQATGNEMNYPEMSKINPQFAKDGVHWINIQSGDALNIPWAWAPKLASLYHIEIDPGVMPPAVTPPGPQPQPSVLPSVLPAVLPSVLPSLPSVIPANIIPGLPSVIPANVIPGLPSVIPANVIPSLPPTPAPAPAPVATGGTYKVLAGDFPIKIAQKLTGNGNRWKELVAANPKKKTAADGNFASLLPGEVLQLPASWSSSTPILTAAHPAGGSNAAHA